MSLEVLQSGVLTTVQDAGRPGAGHWGVSRSGCMDLPALYHANWLVGNAWDTAALEVGQGLLWLRFHRPTCVALAGGKARATLDGRRIWPGWRYRAEAGSELRLSGMERGMYAVLAVQGGFALPPVLESRSTDLFAGMGGFYGRALRNGDHLPLCRDAPVLLSRPAGLRLPESDGRIRVLPGPGKDELPEACWQRFLAQSWTVSPESSRMATLLQGERLPAPPSSMGSRPVLPGTVQLPPSGRPMILQADAQTTGGYPELAQVLRWDLWKLAQARPGQAVFFQPVSLEQARRLDQGWLDHFDNLQAYGAEHD